MSGAAFLRFKKLTGGGKLGIAARHNRRTVQAEWGASESIDPTKTHLNFTLVGPATAADVVTLAETLVSQAKVKPMRKDAVRAIETVFSLPANHSLDEAAYFLACVDWLASRFGGSQNILSADVHKDETAPHCHVLSLPLIQGRMVGSDLVGNRTTLKAHHDSFHAQVGSRFGLKKVEKLSSSARQEAGKAILQWLRQSKDAALKSALWPTLREAIERDPLPHLQALGMDAPKTSRNLRTMAQIFTSPGKGPKKEQNPIGFPGRALARSLCSVGFGASTAMSAAPSPNGTLPTDADLAINNHGKRSQGTARARICRDTPKDSTEPLSDNPITRLRDDDLQTNWYDPETGEFIRPRNSRSA